MLPLAARDCRRCPRFNRVPASVLPASVFLDEAITMPLDPVSAQMLLLQCSGDEIWSVETCRQQGIPESWIEELQGAFESGFDSDRITIYESGRMVNQYHGVLDLHLAYKLAEYLNIDWKRATATALGRQAEVAAIQAELDEI